MSGHYTSRRPLSEFALWGKLANTRLPLSFGFEITARCHNNCRHCYINLPAADREAAARELTSQEIGRIADEAVELGAIWCLLSGGEPLLRRDFGEIYEGLVRRGLLVTVFTTACPITPEHVDLFRRLRPRNLEVTVYGATRETYERVTRTPGSYHAFRRGLRLLEAGGVPFTLKAMALRSNLHEFDEIRAFCEGKTRRAFRYDVQLHLRYDRDAARNVEIQAERLSIAEAIALDSKDPRRLGAISDLCLPSLSPGEARGLLYCGAGSTSFSVTWDGVFQLCSALNHPGTTYDLRKGSLREAWKEFAPRVRAVRPESPTFEATCGSCSLVNVCLWCPAHASLETGVLEGPVAGFCEMAHGRAAAAGNAGDAEAKR